MKTKPITLLLCIASLSLMAGVAGCKQDSSSAVLSVAPDEKVQNALILCQAYQSEGKKPDSSLLDSIAKTGIQVLDFNGSFLVASNRGRDGQNILNAKDSNGYMFVKDMITKAKELKASELGSIYYVWQNQGDKPRTKVGRFACIQEWGWVLYAGAYEEDIQ